MSAYLKKEELLEWLEQRASDYEYQGDNTEQMDEVLPAYSRANEDRTIISTINSGKFDWVGESE